MCPPLRAADDVAEIRAAFKEGGVTDAIATDHAPHGVIDKEVEFDKAAFGIIGFEIALPLALNLVRDGFLTLNEMIRLLTASPAKVFNLSGGTLAVGSAADIVIFDPEKEWTYSKDVILSKSKNSPYLGKTMKGAVVKTLVNGVVKYDSEKGLC
jgi:dihydroorotase